MRVIVIILIFTFSALFSFAQKDSTKVIYCEIVGTSGLLSSKVTVEIDMGESKGFLGINNSYITDEKTGKLKKFNSMVDAMNFMGENGWDFAQAYVVSITGGSSVYHWLLKQTVVKSTDGKYYPATKKIFGN